MELAWEDIVIDKSAVMTTASVLIEDWLWLVPSDSELMLPTACGDGFLRLANGSIAFLDTYAGTCETIATSYQQWKEMLNDPEKLEEWFRGGLLLELLTAGLTREPGECFSPLIPQILSGSWEPSNFHACTLHVHLAMLGQIHQQTKSLPPGTKISGFKVVEG